MVRGPLMRLHYGDLLDRKVQIDCQTVYKKKKKKKKKKKNGYFEIHWNVCLYLEVFNNVMIKIF